MAIQIFVKRYITFCIQFHMLVVMIHSGSFRVMLISFIVTCCLLKACLILSLFYPVGFKCQLQVKDFSVTVPCVSWFCVESICIYVHR